MRECLVGLRHLVDIIALLDYITLTLERINNFGSDVIAGYAAGVKLNNLVITSYTTLGNGISNFTSQNLGAGKKDRIRSGFKAGIKMVWLLTIPFFIIYMFSYLFHYNLLAYYLDLHFSIIYLFDNKKLPEMDSNHRWKSQNL